MAEFYDPVQNITLSYHIDNNLKVKWDKLKDGRLAKTDEDRVYLVDGRERTGKSVFTFQQAKYIDPSFNLSRVCFTPDEFLHAIRTAKKGQVVVFDEAFRGLSSKASQSKVNKKIVQALMEMGQRNLVVFIVLPTFFLLEMYAAVLRSNALFHVYKDKRGDRRFRIYNFNQKSILYQVGKKKGFSYKIPRVKLRGRFFNKYAIEEAGYRAKKDKSFTQTEQSKEEEEGRISLERKVAIVNWFMIFKAVYKKSQEDFCNGLRSVGMNFDQSNLSKIVTEVRKKGLITNYQLTIYNTIKDNKKGK